MANDDPNTLLAEPLLGMWGIEGCADEHVGAVAFEGGQLLLKLFIDGATLGGQEWHHPTLSALKAPKQPTCIGRTRRAGTVTLLRCALSQSNVLTGLQGSRALIELSLWVGQAWNGSLPVDPEGVYTDISFEAPGLHNILANAHLKHEFLRGAATHDGSMRERLHELSQAADAYLVYESPSPKVEIDHRGKKFEIIFSTSISESHSSRAGILIQHSLNSKDKDHRPTGTQRVSPRLRR